MSERYEDGSVLNMNHETQTEEIFAPFVPDEDHYMFVSYSHADRERVFPIIKAIPHRKQFRTAKAAAYPHGQFLVMWLQEKNTPQAFACGVERN